jgi:MarR family transcriptional regulator, organic hydroperoxide resistance regulator
MAGTTEDADGVRPPSAGADPLSQSVFTAFTAIANRQRRLLHRELARQDLHPAQARCLRALIQHGRLGQSELADELDLARPTVTRILQRMERAGLVERTPDAHDQRQTIVTLTARGRDLECSLDDAMTRHLTCTVAMLPEGDRRELARILGLWGEHVQRATADPRNLLE